MTPEETQIFLDADLTFEEKLRKFGEGTYDLSDIDAAAADLMKEGRDLDTAAALIPFYDEHQKQIEAAKASGNPEKILEANLALIMRVGGTAAAEDLLEIVQGPRKSGYEAALDRMHEEEVFASAFSMTHILMKYAQDHDVDVQTVLGRVQKSFLAAAIQDMPNEIDVKLEDQYRELARQMTDKLHELSSQMTDNTRQTAAFSDLFSALQAMECTGDPRDFVRSFDQFQAHSLDYGPDIESLVQKAKAMIEKQLEESDKKGPLNNNNGDFNKHFEVPVPEELLEEQRRRILEQESKFPSPLA